MDIQKNKWTSRLINEQTEKSGQAEQWTDIQRNEHTDGQKNYGEKNYSSN